MAEKVPAKVRSMGAVPAPEAPAARHPRTMGVVPRVPPRAPRTQLSTPALAAAPPAPPAPAPRAIAPSAPRTIPGQVRMGLKVDAQTLAPAFAQHSEKHLLAASRILGSVVIAHFGWNEAQKLGFAAQNQYAEMVQTLLDAATMDVIRKAPVQLSRLLHILELCAQDFNRPSSGVGNWLKKAKPRQFDIHRAEIDQLRQTLQAQMFDVEQPMERVMSALAGLDALFDDLIAHSIAAQWLSTHEATQEAARSALLDRAKALTKTAALVKAQQAQCLATMQQLDALRDRIQEAVLIALPSWLAQLVSFPVALNESQRFVLRDDLMQIISRLKT